MSLKLNITIFHLQKISAFHSHHLRVYWRQKITRNLQFVTGCGLMRPWQRWVREIPREWCKQSTHVVYHLIRCLWWWLICVCVCVYACVPTCSLSVVAVTNVTCKQNHSLSFYGLLYISETVALSVSPDSTANLTTGLLATAGRTELVVLVGTVVATQNRSFTWETVYRRNNFTLNRTEIIY